MLTVHHLENSRSQRILWLLEELGVDYEVKRYERDTETSLAPPELVAVHSLGKSPVITDGDKTIAESGAIIEYLVENHGDGKLWPAAGSPERLACTYWLHYGEGSLMPILLLALIFRRIDESPMPFFVKPIAKGITGKVRQRFIQPNTDRHMAFLEQSLSQSPWFAGAEMTAADIQMSFPIEGAAARIGLSKYPSIEKWLAKVQALPAYERALEKGGPYSLLS